MTGPLLALAAACVGGALAAPVLVETHASVLGELHAAGAAEVAAAASVLSPIALASAVLLGTAGLATTLLTWRMRDAVISDTWGCGYAAPTTRMQYTGGAFAELLHMRVLPRWLRPRLRASAPAGVFPTTASFESETADPLTRSVYEPFLIQWGARLARLRVLQQGNVHIYILYIVVATILALGWVSARSWAVLHGWVSP
jgi:hypothetical protein